MVEIKYELDSVHQKLVDLANDLFLFDSSSSQIFNKLFLLRYFIPKQLILNKDSECFLC